MSGEGTMQLENLVEQAKKGDQQAFEALYQQTYRLVYFHAKAITKSDEEALDLVQDTFLAAYRSLSRLKDSRNFRKWISRIAFNLGCKKLRGAHEVLLGEDEEGEFEALPERDADRLPEESLDRKETVKIVKEVIEGLPVLQRAAVIAYYMDEMGIAEIASLAQCSEGTIKSRLNYARKTMKEQILRKEREMGCRLHVVTAPVIVLALRQMFAGTAVSPEKMALVWSLICPRLSFGPGAASAGAAKGIARGAEEGAMEGAPGAAAPAGGGAAKTAAAVAAAAAKGGIAAAKLKLVVAAAAAVAVTSVGVAGGSYVAYRQEQARQAAAVEGTLAGAVGPNGEVLGEAADAENQIGWVEFEEGWKYRTEDGSFLKDQWEEIGGELYCFDSEEWLRTENFQLGNRIFTVSDSGNLIGVSYDGIQYDGETDQVDNITYYTDDTVYYVVRGDGIHASDLDGKNDRKLCDQGADRIVVEGDWVYFASFKVLYRMKTDGTQLEQWNEDQWIYANSMAVSDGILYVNITDTIPGDGDIPHGGMYEVNWEDQTYEQLPMMLPAFPEYDQMQMEDGWIYFIASNPINEIYGGEAFGSTLIRMSVEDYQIEKISDEGIETFFVHGDTAFCMKDGQAVKYSISQQTEKLRQVNQWFEEDPEGMYQDYLEKVLVPKFGQVTEFSKQYYYRRALPHYFTPMITIEPDPDSAGEPQLGILRSYVDDLNGDGKKEMAVLRIGFRKDEYGQEPYSALILDLYQIMNGEMINFGTEELRTIGPSQLSDAAETTLYVKHYNGACTFLYHRTWSMFSQGDGGWDQMDFISFDTGQYGNVVMNRTEFFEGTGEGEMDQEQLDQTRKQYGFTDQWLKPDAYLTVSAQEPDCEVIFREALGLGASQGGYNTVDGYGLVNEMTALGNFTEHPIYWSMDIDPVQEAPESVGMDSSQSTNWSDQNYSSWEQRERQKVEQQNAVYGEADQEAIGLYQEYLRKSPENFLSGLCDINQDGVRELVRQDQVLVVEQGVVKSFEIGYYKGYFPNERILQAREYGFNPPQKQMALFHDGSKWVLESVSWDNAHYGIRGPLLSYEEFCERARRLEADGYEGWQYTGVEETALRQQYEQYRGEWETVEAFEQKYSRLTSVPVAFD